MLTRPVAAPEAAHIKAVIASRVLPDIEPTSFHNGASGRMEAMELPPKQSPGSVDRIPVLAAEQDHYRLTWPAPDHVMLDYDLLRQERSGDVTGEVTVRLEAPGLRDHLHQARVTLTGTRSRAELANQLAKRLAGPDWPGIVEASSILVLRAYRAGAPAILLRDAVEPIGARELVPPLVLADLPVVINGDGGTGKSMLALALGVMVQTGQPIITGLETRARRNVALLDWEMSPWEHRERLRAITGEPMPDLVYVPCLRPLREEVDRLRRIARDRGIGYWIVDSAAPACGGEPESAEVALAFFGALRALGGGSLIVAHVTKNGDDGKPFGSAFWSNLARSTWYVRKQQEAESDVLNVGLFNRKANTSRLHAPLGLELRFRAERIEIHTTDVADTPELANALPVRARMLALLRTGARTQVDIAEALDVDLEAVRKATARGEGRSFVRVPGPDGIYRWGLIHAS